ncbi:MAG: class I SAM-dependent methyltransferase [Rubripirellula sp.]
MPIFRRFEWDSKEYSDAFACLLRCSTERAVLLPLLTQQLQQLPIQSVAADWGAGTGDLTQLLVQPCSPIFAIEPSPAMRQILKKKLPDVQVLAGDLLTARPPVPIDYALLAHVLYHLPDED